LLTGVWKFHLFTMFTENYIKLLQHSCVNRTQWSGT
jgi:hypothetical protein